MVDVQHKMTLLMFLMSKDDNLLLLTGGLIFAILNSKESIDQSVREQAPELFESSGGQEEEESKSANPYM